jgi:hypothetical protein
MYNVTFRRISATTVTEGRQYYIFWMGVCSLKYPAWNSYVPYCHLWPVRLDYILPHYLISGTIFEKKLFKLKYLFWFSLQVSSGTFFIRRRINRHIIKNVHWAPFKVPVILARFWWNLIFSTDFRKIFKYFIKIRPVESKLFHADGETDMTKLIVASRNFATRLKK